jgi:hypothetical protein
MKRIVVALVLLGAGAADAQDVRAVRATGALRVDGRLDEAAWAAAQPVTALTQREPDEGRPASEATEVRVLFDGDALYVGARMGDRGPLTAPLGRRDLLGLTSDWIGVHLDSRHDHQTAAGFWVNPAGVQNDAAGTDGAWDPSWNAVWEAATTTDSGGWTAEIRIPFSQLRFAGGDSMTWGVQIERIIGRRNEFAYSTLIPRSERDGAARFGHLTGLGGVRTGRRMEVLPYAVARSDRSAPGDNPFRGASEYGAQTGVDVKYRVTSGLVLDATLNPDFGTVEMDAAEVNLSAFETQLGERRPFFLEGAELFDFGAGAVGPGSSNRRLFYTRRIGRRPQLAAPTARADLPQSATILGAGRLTGRPAPGWSVGVLGALAGEERSRYLDADGAVRDALVEPRTHYFAGRALRELRGGQTRVGVMGTATHRWLDERSAASLRGAGYVGGVDWSHDWGNRAWRLLGYLAASRVEGTPAAITATQRGSAHNFQRPDAPHLAVDSAATSLGGWAGQLQLTRQAGEHWRGDAWVAAVSPGYEVNDLGFQFRGDARAAGGRLTYLQNRPGPLFRSFRIDQAAHVMANGAGDRIGGVYFVGTDWQLRDYTRVVLNASVSPPVSNDRMTRGGPLARLPGDRRVFAEVNTDARRPLRLAAGTFLRTQGEAGWGREAWVRATVQPSPRWTVSVAPFLSRTRTGAQYVAQVPDATAPFGRRYVFASLDQTTASLEARLAWTFTPALSLQVYAQPFVSAGDFGAYKELAAPGSFRFDVYGRDRGTLRPAEGGGWRVDPDGAGPAAEFGVGESFGQSDFSVRSLRGSAVLRWEWRPGSTLHLAWQQTRHDQESGPGDFRLRRDPALLFGTRPDNVFVAKLSYWINP